MAGKPKAPEFKTEEEEAEWWPLQEDQLADAFERAAAEGTLARDSLMKRSGAIAPTTIRLDPKDIERAREQAGRKGLRYQTYLKMLIHEALKLEEKRAG